MVTMWLQGGIDESRVFLESLKVWLLAESLGGVESLIEHPYVFVSALCGQSFCGVRAGPAATLTDA